MAQTGGKRGGALVAGAIAAVLPGCFLMDIDTRALPTRQLPTGTRPPSVAPSTGVQVPKSSPSVVAPPATRRPEVPVPPPVIGHKDLGNGLPATQVFLGGMRGMGFAADGALVVLSSAYNRLWRVEPDGRLKAMAGAGQPPDEAAYTDRPAMEVGLGQASMLVADGQRGWLIGEQFAGWPGYGRLTRLAADGRVTRLWLSADADDRRPAAAVPTADGWTLFTDAFKPQRWAVALGKPAVLAKTYGDSKGMDGGAAGTAWSAGVDGQGTLHIAALRAPGWQLLTYDAAADAFSLEENAERGTFDRLAVDANGNRFTYRHDQTTLSVVPAAGGAKRVVFSQLPPGLGTPMQGNGPVQGAALAPDGSVVVYRDDQYFRIVDGQATRIAGYDPYGGSPAGAPLGMPFIQSLCVLDDGRILVTDHVAQRSYAGGADGDFARDALFDGAGMVRNGAQGKVVVYDVRGLTMVAADGKRTPLFPNGSTASIAEFMVAADGSVYWTETAVSGLKRITAAGVVSEAAPDTPRGQVGALAQAPDGTIYAAATQSVWKLENGAWVKAFDDQGIGDGFGGSPGCLAVDARGRVYASASTRHQVLRWDPQTGKQDVVAGVGGPIYNGVGVEASLSIPGVLAFDKNGDLLIGDAGHQQVKRVPAGNL